MDIIHDFMYVFGYGDAINDCRVLWLYSNLVGYFTYCGFYVNYKDLSKAIKRMVRDYDHLPYIEYLERIRHLGIKS